MANCWLVATLNFLIHNIFTLLLLISSLFAAVRFPRESFQNTFLGINECPFVQSQSEESNQGKPSWTVLVHSKILLKGVDELVTVQV